MRITLLLGILPGISVGLLSGCSLLSTAKMDTRVKQIDVMIQQLSEELQSVQDPEKRAKIGAQIALLRREKESIGDKIKAAEKAREGAGAGIESILAIAGLLLGVPLLGSVGAGAKAIITKGGV